MQSYRDLRVWQKAIELVLEIYRVTATFPSGEQYGLTAQLRRAAVSIASNIAEGKGRHTAGEYLLLLSHARGSLDELETQVHIATLVGYINEPSTAHLSDIACECGRLLNGLMRSLRR